MGLHEVYKVALDAVFGGSFIGNTLEAAKHIIDDMALSSLWREEITYTKEELVDLDTLPQAIEKSLGYVNATCNSLYPQI